MNAYNADVAAQRKQTMLGGLLDRLDGNNDSLFMAVNRLENCIERIAGPEPKSPQSPTAGAQPAGAGTLVQQIEQRLVAGQNAAVRLHALAEKFEQLA